jgi:SAM-dependent methyltransferase
VDRDEDAIRKRVAESYGRIADAEPDCCQRRSQDTTVHLFAYDSQEVVELPAAAVMRSCGCGNPASVSDLQLADVVLDLGCGAGIDLLLTARKVGPEGRVIGVDMTDAMVEQARANVAAAGLSNVDVRRGFIEALPVATESVDWVISNCVINLSPNKPRVFAEIARVLKPGGRLRIADIVAEDLPEWVRSSNGLYDSCVAGTISEAEYVAGLRAAGLTRVSVGGRFVYDRQQLYGIATGALASSAEANRVADALVGRVWSVYFSASKPTQRTRGPSHG